MKVLYPLKSQVDESSVVGESSVPPKTPIQESYYTKVTPKFNQINVLIHSNTRVTVFKSSFFPLFNAFMNKKMYFHAYLR